MKSWYIEIKSNASPPTKFMRKIHGSQLKNVLGQLFRWLDEDPEEEIAVTWYGKIRVVIVLKEKYEKMAGKKMEDNAP